MATSTTRTPLEELTRARESLEHAVDERRRLSKTRSRSVDDVTSDSAFKGYAHAVTGAARACVLGRLQEFKIHDESEAQRIVVRSHAQAAAAAKLPTVHLSVVLRGVRAVETMERLTVECLSTVALFRDVFESGAPPPPAHPDVPVDQPFLRNIILRCAETTDPFDARTQAVIVALRRAAGDGVPLEDASIGYLMDILPAFDAHLVRGRGWRCALAAAPLLKTSSRMRRCIADVAPLLLSIETDYASVVRFAYSIVFKQYDAAGWKRDVVVAFKHARDTQVQAIVTQDHNPNHGG